MNVHGFLLRTIATFFFASVSSLVARWLRPGDDIIRGADGKSAVRTQATSPQLAFAKLDGLHSGTLYGRTALAASTGQIRRHRDCGAVSRGRSIRVRSSLVSQHYEFG